MRAKLNEARGAGISAGLTEASAWANFARRWYHHVQHASAPYWVTQSVVALVTVFVTTQVLDAAADANMVVRSNRSIILRALSDAAVLFILTHLLMRPLLCIQALSEQRWTRRWLWLVCLVLVCGAISVVIGEAASALAGERSGSVREVRFDTGSGQFSVPLEGWKLWMARLLNATLLYGAWASAYLGWKAFEARRALQRQVHATRLWQLTQQMSPHFIFNAFNSIRGMIYEDRDRAADLVTQLSALLRFHLATDDRVEQTLAEECALAQRYLKLESGRLESRLTYVFDIADECLGLNLPTMVVLTLVENAIKHGISPNREGGNLRVSARRALHGWVLEVSNSVGAGRSENSSSTGLRNLKERLALTKGPQARVDHWREAHSYHVRMELPL